MEVRHDAIVVGSGAAGGWAAMELCERGLSVLLLEAGPLFANSRQPDFGDALVRKPIQARCYAFNEHTHQFFVDDLDHPYETDAPFDWIRGRQLGGRMQTWSAVCLRMSDHDFKAATLDGVGDDWPIAYADIAPYYDRVESFIGIAGTREGIEHLPDGVFREGETLGTRLGAAERQVGDVLASRWPDRRLIPSRRAIGTHDQVLARAMATGRLTIRPDAVVSHVLVAGGRARGVAFVDRLARTRHEAEANLVVLGASTIESTRILMSSGIGARSGVLGRYLMDHTSKVGIVAIPTRAPLPDDADKGHRARLGYIPRFQNLGTKEPGFVRGYGVESASVSKFRREPPLPPALEHQRRLMLFAFGEVLPRAENHVTLSDARDAWGMPIPHVHMRYGENEHAMIAHQIAFVRELAREAALEVLYESATPAAPGNSVHEVGTARMGSDPARSVLDPYNRCWDAPNVLVTDGACFVTSSEKNPTLTIMALTARACERAAADAR